MPKNDHHGFPPPESNYRPIVEHAYEDPENIKHVRSLLTDLGEDWQREGLLDTPKRWLKAMEEFLSPDKFELTCFDSDGYNEMVVVKDIPFFSLCEHHMLPFFGTAAIAYIPDGKIVGISKLPRTLDKFARRLQNQERITQQITNYLYTNLQPKGVACVITARHLCMEMRGIQAHAPNTTTSSLVGVFKSDPACRNEFLNLLK